VTLRPGARTARLSVEDDGCGFDPERTIRRDSQSGSGLLIMQERATALGGDFRLQSKPRAGTRLECTFRVAPE